MSRPELERLRATLLAITPTDVDEPDLPIATMLQEANDVASRT